MGVVANRLRSWSADSMSHRTASLIAGERLGRCEISLDILDGAAQHEQFVSQLFEL